MPLLFLRSFWWVSSCEFYTLLRMPWAPFSLHFSHMVFALRITRKLAVKIESRIKSYIISVWIIGFTCLTLSQILFVLVFGHEHFIYFWLKAKASSTQMWWKGNEQIQLKLMRLLIRFFLLPCFVLVSLCEGLKLHN